MKTNYFYTDQVKLTIRDEPGEYCDYCKHPDIVKRGTHFQLSETPIDKEFGYDYSIICRKCLPAEIEKAQARLDELKKFRKD